MRSRSFLYFTFSALSLTHDAWAKLYTDPSQLSKTQYDFIVVGAGTAGNVVARRLAENPAYSVLVIEAGISNDDNTALQIPFLAPTLLSNTSLYWEYQTTPQKGLNNRVLNYERGKLLGGSSSINFQIYNRGSRDDFDRIAKVTGDAGWSWDTILPFMKKYEKFTQPTDGHNITGQFNPSAHGFDGVLRTTLPNFPTDIDSRIVKTTQTNPAQFPFNLDSNAGNTIGISWTQSTTGGGERSSSATAYLQPVINQNNIDVLINSQVTKLVNVAEKGATPDLRGVEFAKDANSKRFNVRANKEVVLSAGTVNTPQLLLLSGVGDKTALSKLGIPVVADSPGVGQNLQDHPCLTNQWSVNSSNTFDPLPRNETLVDELIQQWATTRTGPLTIIPVNLIAWLRLANTITGHTGQDPSAGPTSSHMELLPVNQFVSFKDPSPSTGSFFTIMTNVVSPVSRGSVTLKSSNPFDFPIIDPAYLADPFDVNVMVQAVKTAQALVATSPWKGFIAAPFGDFGKATNDAELVQYIRSQVTTFWHPTSSAKMGKANDPTAVVDPSLLVKGVQGVRVVDASVFPYIPAAHPQGAIYAIAERAASLIASKWK